MNNGNQQKNTITKSALALTKPIDFHYIYLNIDRSITDMESFRYGSVDKHHWPNIHTSTNNRKY